MDRVRVFLRTELFTTGELHPAPAGATIVDGRVRELLAGGLILEATAFHRADGKTLHGAPCTLYLPSAKIDHVLLLEDKA